MVHPWGADRARLLGIRPSGWVDYLPVTPRPRSVAELMEHYPEFTRKEAGYLVFVIRLIERGRMGS